MDYVGIISNKRYLATRSYHLILFLKVVYKMWIERADEITHYIRQGGESVIPSTGILLFMGERQVLPIYKIPTSLLTFNMVNGRFAAEKRKKEEELGFELDSRNIEHEKYFIDMLLPKGAKSDKLLNDLVKNGQLKPGVITNDGFVVDANRRLAAMKYLNSKTPDSKYQYLLTHRLPANIPPVEIYKLEVQFQIKDDLKEEYDPINDLLKIKEGLELMPAKELAETLDWSEKEVLSYVRRLELVDGFLDFIHSPGNYTKVLDFNEHFNEFQKEFDAMKRAGVPPLRRDEAVDAFYYALRVNLDKDFDKSVTQRDHIRYMRHAFLNDKIYNVLTRNMFSNPNASTEDIYNDVSAAAELARIQRSNDKPIEYLRKSFNMLSQMPLDHETLLSEEFVDMFEEFEIMVKQIRQKIGGNNFGKN